MNSIVDVQTITTKGSDKETVITLQGSPSCHCTHSLDRLDIDMNLLLWVSCNHFLLQNYVQIQAELSLAYSRHKLELESTSGIAVSVSCCYYHHFFLSLLKGIIFVQQACIKLKLGAEIFSSGGESPPSLIFVALPVARRPVQNWAPQ